MLYAFVLYSSLPEYKGYTIVVLYKRKTTRLLV